MISSSTIQKTNCGPYILCDAAGTVILQRDNVDEIGIELVDMMNVLVKPIVDASGQPISETTKTALDLLKNSISNTHDK